MKKTYSYTYFLLVLAMVGFSLQGCKKFLNVDPVDAMSGNNFWKSKKDVEQFTNGLYRLLRTTTCGDGSSFAILGPTYVGTINGSALLGMADLRNTPWRTNSNLIQNSYIGFLNKNNINSFINNKNSYPEFGVTDLADWGTATSVSLSNITSSSLTVLFQTRGGFYSIISGANAIIDKINSSDITDISQQERDIYKAEAIFIRSLVYFIMVRHWGDVPYITELDDKTPKERVNQIEVLKNCLTDLKANLDKLPWTYSDRAKRGTRAMRGGALALMMEMNMWMACFDMPNERNYFQEVINLGTSLINDNGGAYALLPIDNFKEIFKGNTSESLFEIGQNFNYGETFSQYANIASIVLRTPYKTEVGKSVAFYDSIYLTQLYDAKFNGLTDRRKDVWFEQTYMYDNTQNNFVFLKFLNIYTDPIGRDLSNDDKILFRYPDAYLLRAEAYQKLGQDALAIADLNVVRNRSSAEIFTTAGSGVVDTENGDPISLEDAIWWEREREFMGEGKLFYDLVRTKKIMSSLYTPNPMLYDDFRRGAWTYPISADVIRKNPKIKPNDFWLSN